MKQWITQFIKDMDIDKNRLLVPFHKSIYTNCKRAIELENKINKPNIKIMKRLQLQQELISILDSLGNQYTEYLIKTFRIITDSVQCGSNKEVKALTEFNEELNSNG